MLKDYVISESDQSPEGGGEHLRLHVIDSDKFNYREVVSFDAFFHGIKQRNFVKGVKLFFARSRQEYDQSLASFNKIMGEHGQPPKPPLPEVHHANIWEFYKYIGYDYKKQKWIKKP